MKKTPRTTQYSAPWRDGPLKDWRLIAIYQVGDGADSYLKVTMVRKGRVIEESGNDDQYLWNRLCHQVWAIERAEAAAPKPAVTFVRTPKFRMHQVVRLTTRDFNDRKLRKGAWGSVVHIYPTGGYEVEFRRKSLGDSLVLTLEESQIESIPLH